MPATYTVKQVADILGYSTNSIYTFLKEGRIQSVRVGKGRFRIPQHEVDRLLVLAKSNTLAVPSPQISGEQSGPVFTAPVQPLSEASSAPAQPAFVPKPSYNPALSVWSRMGSSTLEVPGMLDWLIILAAMLVGISIPFVWDVRSDMEALRFSIAVPALTACFIGGGIGLFLVRLWNIKAKAWLWIFSLVLAAAFGGYALVRALGQDWGGAFLYGLLGIMTAASRFVRFAGLSGFVIFLWLMLQVFPLTMIMWRTDPMFAEFLAVSPWQFSGVWYACIGIGMAIGWAVLLTYHKARNWFHAVMIASAGLCVIYSFWLAVAAMWTRAFTFILIAALAVLAPYWEQLPLEHRRDRKIIIGLFCIMLSLFVSAGLIVRISDGHTLMDTSATLSNAARESTGKIAEHIQGSKEVLVSFARLPIMQDAVSRDDTAVMMQLLRGMYESTGTMKRLVIVRPPDAVLVQYPLTDAVPVPGSVPVSDGFMGLLTTGQPQVTEELDMATVPPQVTLQVAVPVVMPDTSVSAVLVGWLRMSDVNNELQKRVHTGKGEQVTVVDRSGRIVLHADPSQLGSTMSVEKAVWNGVNGQRGVGEDYDSSRRERYLVAYDTLPAYGWGVAASVPVRAAIRSVSGASIVVVSLLTMVGVVIMAFLLGRKIRFKVWEGRPEDTS